MRWEFGYRRVALAITGILGALILWGLSLYVAYQRHVPDGDAFLDAFLLSTGVMVAFVAWLLLSTWRRHAWTAEPGALLVEERPLVPPFGRRRRARLPYASIRELRLVENGLDALLELEAADGRVFRLMAPQGNHRALDPVAEAISEGRRAAGPSGAGAVPGLGFWSRGFGLATLGVAFLLSAALAAAALFALIEGEPTVRPRMGEGYAVAFLLPIGVGWLIRTSWRRRRRVLALRAAR